MSKHILLVGGGSGGHVFPLIAVAEALKTADSSTRIMMLGDGPFLAEACAAAGLKYKRIHSGKLRRYFDLRNLLVPFQSFIGLLQSLWILFWFMPDAVLTKGGAVAVMPALAARLYAIRVYTHESDAVPGLANRVIGKFAKLIFVSFESTEKYFKEGRAVLSGLPIRPGILSGSKEEALQKFNLRGDRKTILVAGGSQGAKRINDLILDSLISFVKTYQIIHQCGQGQLPEVKKTVERYGESPEIQANYRLFPFFDSGEMALAYAAADVVISRGGASNLFEISALGKPAIIIPLSLAASRGDQIDNAKEFQTYGGIMMEEENITPALVLNQLQELLEPDRYREVSLKIKSFAKLDAASHISQILLS